MTEYSREKGIRDRLYGVGFDGDLYMRLNGLYWNGPLGTFETESGYVKYENNKIATEAAMMLERMLPLLEQRCNAIEVASGIAQNPKGSLWNHGTTPTRKEEIEWASAKGTAEEILTYLTLES